MTLVIDETASDYVRDVASIAKKEFVGALPDKFLRYLGDQNESRQDLYKYGAVVTESRQLDKNSGNVIPDLPTYILAVSAGNVVNADNLWSFMKLFTNAPVEMLTPIEILNILSAVPKGAGIEFYKKHGLIIQPVATLLWKDLLQTAHMVMQTLGSAA